MFLVLVLARDLKVQHIGLVDIKPDWTGVALPHLNAVVALVLPGDRRLRADVVTGRAALLDLLVRHPLVVLAEDQEIIRHPLPAHFGALAEVAEEQAVIVRATGLDHRVFPNRHPRVELPAGGLERPRERAREIEQARRAVPIFVARQIFAVDRAEPAGLGHAQQLGDQVGEVLEELVVVDAVTHIGFAVRVHVQVAERRREDREVGRVARQLARPRHAVTEEQLPALAIRFVGLDGDQLQIALMLSDLAVFPLACDHLRLQFLMLGLFALDRLHHIPL